MVYQGSVFKKSSSSININLHNWMMNVQQKMWVVQNQTLEEEQRTERLLNNKTHCQEMDAQ
jgi:hypothetical protein